MPTHPFAQLLTWWSAQLAWRQSPTLWVLASLGLAVVGANLWWLTVRSDRRPARQLTARLATQAGSGLAWLLTMAWLIGPGYAALLVGAASPRLMGLSQIDWGAGLGQGVGVAALFLVVLLVAGLSYRRSLPTAPSWPSLSAAVAGSALLMCEAGALQWQWAFYRSAAIEGAAGLGASSPLLVGTWLGAGLVALQGGLSPWFWLDLRTPGLAERQVLRAVLLVTTSVVFLLSRNFWLGWALHAGAVVLLEPRLAPRATFPPFAPLRAHTHTTP